MDAEIILAPVATESTWPLSPGWMLLGSAPAVPTTERAYTDTITGFPGTWGR